MWPRLLSKLDPGKGTPVEGFRIMYWKGPPGLRRKSMRRNSQSSVRARRIVVGESFANWRISRFDISRTALDRS